MYAFTTMTVFSDWSIDVALVNRMFMSDAFKINQKRRKVSIETRHARFIENIKAALESHAPEVEHPAHVL
jgi:hypothetical protein